MTTTALRSTLQALARAVAATNTANGWSDGFTTAQIPERIALIHSEVSEASRERGRARRAQELGDVQIRTLHLCELIAPDLLGELLWEPCLPERRPPLPVRIWLRATRPWQDLQLHGQISATLETYRKADAGRVNVLILHQLLDLIERVNALLLAELPARTTPTELILEINAANAERGHRHGGLRC
ncbi:hypothetical protein [Deinococcus soli (ex Cha et al. 2016)]|uniref:Uncharacterized protein n=1 Tax=Deinococcus soli (ex Cha et al. 2016) TaxID=1309411 RepID=A0ACC6KNM9_9DEIO|nr:hypothetical protein [Deinococcus soli (ex Cha et al. 2016)]MDR6330661.1 hypothetical protein [Deinococcus soli (ex Cha et al. 2016)]MDR6754028.1 hypothetical protein [Deinococcus soli (ex Cha et al. 2016)]